MSKILCSLTVEQAIGVLPDGDEIHTFRGALPMLIGADWSRESILKALAETDVIAPTGSFARGMNHGIAINAGGRPLFIATDETKLAALEASYAEATP